MGGEQVAVVTVTRSPGEALDRFLDSLKAATDRSVRVLLADVGSTDGAPERALERDGVDLLRIGEAVARAAAVNRAIAQLDAAWVAVAQPAVEWGESALDTLLAAAERYPRAGVLAPALRSPDGRPHPSAFALPTAPDLLRGRAPVAAGPGPVGWVAASCLLLRRAAWESVDGFDARHPEPFDAVDLGLRLGRAGWLSVAVPAATVTVAAAPQWSPVAGGRYVRERLGWPWGAVAARVLEQRGTL